LPLIPWVVGIGRAAFDDRGQNPAAANFILFRIGFATSLTNPAGPCCPRIVWAGGYLNGIGPCAGGISGGTCCSRSGKACLGPDGDHRQRLGFPSTSKCFCTSRMACPGKRQRLSRRLGPASHQVGRECQKLFSRHPFMHAADSAQWRKPRSRPDGRRSWWRHRGGTSTARAIQAAHIKARDSFFATFLALRSAVKLAVLPAMCSRPSDHLQLSRAGKHRPRVRPASTWRATSRFSEGIHG